MKDSIQTSNSQKFKFPHAYGVRAPPLFVLAVFATTRQERKRNMSKRGWRQYPYAYKPDNTDYTYYDDNGKMITLYAGKDGVTADIIAELKRLHRNELVSEDRCKLIRKDSEGHKRAMVISLDSISEDTKEESKMLIDPKADVESILLKAEEKEGVWLAYKKLWNILTDRQRVLFKKIWIEHMSQREIAKELGLAESTISRHVDRINVKIEKIISEDRQVLAYFPRRR